MLELGNGASQRRILNADRYDDQGLIWNSGNQERNWRSTDLNPDLGTLIYANEHLSVRQPTQTAGG
jgi:hypothetical protein